MARAVVQGDASAAAQDASNAATRSSASSWISASTNTSISPPSTRGTPGLVTWQRWSVTYVVEIKFRTPHAVDATLSPMA